jgi:putative ABC transport system permease protein
MLRTLGASRSTVLQGVAAEFSALGFLSGALAAFGATAIGWILAYRLFSLPFTVDPAVWLLGLGCGTLLVGLAGTLATWSVVSTPPIVTLRDE